MGTSSGWRSLLRGYDITEVCDGYQMWSMGYYEWLWDEHDSWYFLEQDPNAIKVQ
jgi:hypothetical protein